MQHPTSCCRLLPLARAVACVSVALAAPVAAANSLVLEEVIVTAERRESTLQDTPIAVTAFSSDKIAELGIYSVADIGGLAPNTNIQKQPSSNANMSIYIRGVGSGESSVIIDPKTSFYIDGIYSSKTVGAVFDIVDLERIEVLRGPQGTLFGRNSTGGAVNVTTVKPSGNLGAALEAGVGNDGYHRLAGSVDLPQLADMLSVKLSAMSSEYDGWAKNTAESAEQSELGGEDSTGFRAALRLESVDSLVLDYAYDRTDNTYVPVPWQVTHVHTELYNGITTTPFPFALLGGDLYRQMAADIGDPDHRRERFYYENYGDEQLDVEGHTFTAQWDINPFTIKYIFGDRETEMSRGDAPLGGGTYYARDLFWADLNPALAVGDVVAKDAFTAYNEKTSVELTTHELQVIGDAFGGRVQYTGGLFYYEEQTFEYNPQRFNLPIQLLIGSFPAPLQSLYQSFGYCDENLVCFGSQQLPFLDPTGAADPNLNGFADFAYGQETKSKAAYGQVTWSISQRIDLSAGLRYTEDDKEAFLFNEDFGHAALSDAFVGDDQWDNLSYLLRMNWAMSDDISFYGTFSTGYNGGGFNARASSEASFRTPFAEEELQSFEVGMKSEWMDSRVRANLALFYNDYTDIQIAQFEAGSGGASSNIVNAGDATYQGLEVDLTAILAEGWLLDFNYGYLDAQFNEYLALDPATNEFVDISDRTTVTRAPEHNANLGLQYDFRPFSFGVLSARVDVSYTDEFVYHVFNNQYDSTDAHTLVNARLSLSDVPVNRDGVLRFSLWGKNLTDEEYRQWGIDFGSLGYAGGTYNRPTTYGIDVTYRFR
ncbi:TonB-dependent receptor [Parahaliea mediterranea]|uniref:TonB-dependent receptor n=1 Tax=Parahaliea mediterranea TaxID=651086 RepID=UPI0014729FFE|nr:TonB-dependent receptor [Parahaliea mediterranea]